MRLPRPYIPLDVRLQVAARQFPTAYALASKVYPSPGQRRLDFCLQHQFDGPCDLDHDPALVNRQWNPRTKRYSPDANDPAHLIYRARDDHGIKTRVRGDGAQYSDLALRRKNKRIADKDRPIRKIPSRPFRNKGDR